jgi:hypothetical protein
MKKEERGESCGEEERETNGKMNENGSYNPYILS